MNKITDIVHERRADAATLKAIMERMDEHVYVIKRNSDDVEAVVSVVKEVKETLNGHISRETSDKKEYLAKFDPILDYIDKMSAGVWFMSKIKSIAMWIAAVVAGSAALIKTIQYFGGKN